ncbi:MAG: amidohydrolase family protein [Lentisphaeria bacterium]|nr:amidohydrolase family protein [Lentisphaeria bacterium]
MNRRDFLKGTLTFAALMPMAKLFAAGSGNSAAAPGDLLFTNVQLYDGTGKAPFMADVAVRGDKIAAVAPSGTFNRTGCTVIDGRGKALVPGFIDVHTHSDSALYRIPSADSKLMQGVTTDISGNCGTSYYLAGAKGAKDALRKAYGNFKAYLDLVEKASPAVNCAHLCGHNSLRIHVMGYENRRPTKEEMRRMKELLADALANGAAGFSSGLYYLPGKFADTEEVKELASLLKGTGKPYTTHMRSESDTILEALAEAIEIARAGDNNLEVSHFKTCFQRNWGKLDRAFEMIAEARRSGMNVLEDRYPYVYSSTSLRVIVPPPFDKVSPAKLCGRLKKDAAYRAELTEALRTKGRQDMDRILLVSSPVAKHRPYYSKNMVEIGQMMGGISPQEAVVNLLASGSSPSAAFGSMNEDNMKRILADPYVVCCTDSSIRAKNSRGGHPRAFGSFPLFFRIASKSCPYAEVIRRMTSLPAAKFNIRGRGVIAPGFFADLVLIDLDSYDSKADFAVVSRVPTGIEAVYVNGQLAYSPDPGVKTVRAGKVLRIK